MSKNKYWKLVSAGLLILICVLLGYSWKNIEKIETLTAQLTVEKSNYPEIYNVIDSITVSNFREMVKNNKEFIVYVGRPTCGDCTEFEPKLIEMLEDKKLQDTILYLNVAQIRKNEDDWNHFKEEFGIQYTPTIAKFDNGNIVDKVNWTPEEGTDLEKFDSFLNKYKKEQIEID
jgi:predicted bacteriocin transport accessory protein